MATKKRSGATFLPRGFRALADHDGSVHNIIDYFFKIINICKCYIRIYRRILYIRIFFFVKAVIEFVMVSCLQTSAAVGCMYFSRMVIIRLTL